MILTAYLDASGSADSEVLTVAGYVSSETKLRRFSKQWARLLGKYRLRSFHMTDFIAGTGPYKRWRRKGDDRLLSFVRVANRAAMFPVSVSIPFATYNALSASYRERCGNPYFFAAWGCFHEITRWLRATRSERDSVAYVYDQGDQGRGEVFKVFNLVHDDARLRAMHRIVSMEFQSKERFTPIQAADIVAWAAQDEVLKQLGVHRPPRPMPLQELRMPRLLYPTVDQLRDVAARFAQADIRRGRRWKTNPINPRGRSL